MKGVYVLLITVNEPTLVRIRSLGLTFFDKGNYAYVGSAQNNLANRIARHLEKDKVEFWHIDYLLAPCSVDVTSVFTKKASRHEECTIAERLGSLGKRIEGFGSSDCRCPSHLFMIEEARFLSEFVNEFPPVID